MTTNCTAPRSRSRNTTRQLSDARFEQGGAYARWRGFLFGRLQYDLGPPGRSAPHVGSGMAPLPGDPYRTETHGVVSPKIGARVLLGGPWSAVGNVSRGFRSAIGSITNPNQPLVSAWSGELGLQAIGSRVRGQLSLFQTDTRNERILDPVTLAGERRREEPPPRACRGRSPRLSAPGSGCPPKRPGMTPGSPAQTARERSCFRRWTTARGSTRSRSDAHDESAHARLRGARRGRTPRPCGSDGGRDLGASRPAPLRWSGPFTPIGEPAVHTRPYSSPMSEPPSAFPGGARLILNCRTCSTRGIRRSAPPAFSIPGAPRTLRAALRLPSPHPEPEATLMRHRSRIAPSVLLLAPAPCSPPAATATSRRREDHTPGPPGAGRQRHRDGGRHRAPDGGRKRHRPRHVLQRRGREPRCPEDDHYSSLTFLPATGVTSTLDSTHHFRHEVVNTAAPGTTGDIDIGYGHDAAADEHTFTVAYKVE